MPSGTPARMEPDNAQRARGTEQPEVERAQRLGLADDLIARIKLDPRGECMIQSLQQPASIASRIRRWS